MKKIFFFFLLVCSLGITAAHSQWAFNGNNIYNTNAGNVGIGIANPVYPLEVNGAVYTYSGLISNAATPGAIAGHFRGASNGNGNVVIQGGQGIGYNAWWMTGTPTVFRIGGQGGTEPALGALNIDFAGRVGVNRNPEFNLDVSGTSRIGAAASTNANLIIQGGAGTGYNAWWMTGTASVFRLGASGSTEPSLGAINIDNAGKIGLGRNPEFPIDAIGTTRIGAATGANANMIIQGGGGLGFNAWWFTGTSTTLKLGGSGGTEPSLGAINIDFAGNVGIGTNSVSNYKLVVDGKIGAREIKVTLQNPWPDFVFDKNYKRVPLNELASYIETNRHLPGIPSASDVKENEGIELGDMNARLLQKVEELTLYIIDLKKEIDELKKKSGD